MEFIIACIFCIVIVALFVFVILQERQRKQAFEERWPAIDDDEFVRRCAPGTNRETALKVRRIVSDALGVPYDQIYPEQSFVYDLNCD